MRQFELDASDVVLLNWK